MSHVILHLGLCSAMLKRSPQTDIPIHIRLVDRGGQKHVDETVHTMRGYESTVTVAFDTYQGEFAMMLNAPKYGCSGFDWIHVLPQRDRLINEQLVDGQAPRTQPMLMEGTAPASFLYLQPTYVLFDKSAQCNKPVPGPIPMHLTIENDQDSFYLWLYPDASLYQRGPEILAMQLQTATGEEHYIRLKVPFPPPWQGWPDDITFNIKEDDADYLATQPTGVLLCPKLFETSAG